jgi:hypothetical protein
MKITSSELDVYIVVNSWPDNDDFELVCVTSSKDEVKIALEDNYYRKAFRLNVDKIIPFLIGLKALEEATTEIESWIY